MCQQILGLAFDSVELVLVYADKEENQEPVRWIVQPCNVIEQQAQRPEAAIDLAGMHIVVKPRKALIAKAPILAKRTMNTAYQAVVIHAPANGTSAARAEHHLGITQ